MLERIFYSSVLVGDQDRALDFYTNVLGLETMCVAGGQGQAMIVERLN